MDLVSKTENLLGTVFEIKLLKKDSDFFHLCFLELKRIEKEYSRFLDDSLLSRVNSSLNKWVQVTDEFIYLLDLADEFKKNSNGNFDITVKSILDNLGYDKNYSFKEKQTFFSFPSFGSSIEINRSKKQVLLRKEIDFGGFGKGYAIDRIASILNSNKITHYYINGGGDIYSKKDPLLDAWEILLEHPDDPNKALGKIKLDSASIAGSSPNHRKWGEHHHIINMKTKKSAKGVKAIFILAKNATDADAFATALFSAGFEEGIEISKELDIEILIVSDRNKMYKSPGFEIEFY